MNPSSTASWGTPAATPHHAPQVYLSPRTRSRWAVAMLAVMAVVGMLLMLMFLLEWVLAGTTPDDISGAVIVMITATVLAILLVVPTAVAVITWLYRCCRNLPALGAREIRWAQPAWAIGAWFLPYLGTLVAPFVVVREAWLASDPVTWMSTRGLRRGVPASVLLWWIAYALAVNLIALPLLLAGDVNNPDAGHVIAGAVVGAVASILWTAAALLAIVMVLRLTRRQEDKQRALTVYFQSRPQSASTTTST